MPRTEQLLELWKQAFGDCGGFWEAFFRCAYEPDRCIFLEENGQIQAALYWFDCDCHGPWAYVFAVATHPEHRGKGLCRRLMAKAHGRFRELGYRGALLVPADAGLRQMYARLGYREAACLEEYTCAAQTPISLHEIGTEEYAALRRDRLPHCGVIQEGAALRLLEASGVRFFRGEGCLLAAENSRILEYLGSRSQASGAVAALGWTQAVIRTPGKGMPFAMACPLREDAVLPEYFAFAFD